jgi:hypothetical protein
MFPKKSYRGSIDFWAGSARMGTEDLSSPNGFAKADRGQKTEECDSFGIWQGEDFCIPKILNS